MKTIRLLGSLVLAGVLTSPASVFAQKTVVAWTAVSALNSPYWVMKEAGFLKQEGLDVDLIYIPSSATVAQAMLAGEVAVSAANSQVVADSGLQGGIFCRWERLSTSSLSMSWRFRKSNGSKT